jgi:hypothetical protein
VLRLIDRFCAAQAHADIAHNFAEPMLELHLLWCSGGHHYCSHVTMPRAPASYSHRLQAISNHSRCMSSLGTVVAARLDAQRQHCNRHFSNLQRILVPYDVIILYVLDDVDDLLTMIS